MSIKQPKQFHRSAMAMIQKKGGNNNTKIQDLSQLEELGLMFPKCSALVSK